MIKNINDGGLRMSKSEKFIKALKISWLQRILTSTDNCIWSSLSSMDFSKLISFEDGYAKQKVKDLRNPFWIYILNSWKGFIDITKIFYRYH